MTTERRLTIAQALREAIAEEMRRDPSVFLIGEDIGVKGGFGGAFGVYLGLNEEFGPERIIDTPISEKAIAGAAIGAALMGMRPVADMQYADFLFECMDELVKRSGKDVTIVATHRSVYRSLAAAEELATRGRDCEVIDPLSLVPLDTQTLWQSVRRTGRLVIVHEDTLTGGWGAEIAARAADECHYYLESPIKRVATLDMPLPFAPIMEQAVVPSIVRIRAVILGLV